MNFVERSDDTAILRRSRADRRRRPLRPSYFGEHRGRIEDSLRDGRELGFEVRPTAIYANPVLLDLIDREMKQEFNIVCRPPGCRRPDGEDALHAGRRSTIDPGMVAAYTGTPGSGWRCFPPTS